MWSLIFFKIGLLGTFSGGTNALKENNLEPSVEHDRTSKLLPIFQIVRFPNDVCEGTSRNGTCFTAYVTKYELLKQIKTISLYYSEECSSKNGVSDGSCASGFGVCCIGMYPNL